MAVVSHNQKVGRMRTIIVLLLVILAASCGTFSPQTTIWPLGPIPTGSPGPAGKDGKDGTNGADGQDGSNATLGPDTPIEAISPCGANSSPYKEVLLCLNNGNILASFSDSASGQNTRFAIIPVGHYNDTDSSGCQFEVELSEDLKSHIVLWNAGSNQYSLWLAGSYTCRANL